MMTEIAAELRQSVHPARMTNACTALKIKPPAASAATIPP